MISEIKKTDQRLKESNYKFMGWMNGWTIRRPHEVNECYEKQHPLNTINDNDTCDHTISCDICKIYWKYDSGD